MGKGIVLNGIRGDILNDGGGDYVILENTDMGDGRRELFIAGQLPTLEDVQAFVTINSIGEHAILKLVRVTGSPAKEVRQ